MSGRDVSSRSLYIDIRRVLCYNAKLLYYIC